MLMQRLLSTSIILPLTSIEATLTNAGGKGESLAKMARAGFPIPEGYVITTAAYNYFVSANNLQEKIKSIVNDINTDSPFAIKEASENIQALFLQAVMPETIARMIVDAYEGLETPDMPVAVRSSATAEDLPDHSFAGQQQSYLNVQGIDILIESVIKCWASLWSTTAISYRNRAGIDHSTIAMGVVVQTMIAADIAGVMFTVNPTTGDKNKMVINAAYGLGEAVVSGRVTPDLYMIDRESSASIETIIGDKALKITPANECGVIVNKLPEREQLTQTLTAEQIVELANIALRVEKFFGGLPQDIEWAIAENRIYLLQSRPITAMPAEPAKEVKWEPPTPGSKWVHRQVVENMPDPLSPLFDELYLNGLDDSATAMQTAMGVPRFIMVGLFDKPQFATINGYAYMRASMNIRWWSAPLIIPGLLIAMVAGVTKMLRNAGIKYWRDDVLPDYLQLIAKWKKDEPFRLSDQDLFRCVKELARGDALYWFACTLAVGTAKVSDSLLNSFLSGFAQKLNLSSSHFMRGFPSKTIEAGIELEAITEEIGKSTELLELVRATPAHELRNTLKDNARGRVLFEKLTDYLEQYGHQIYSLDFAEPTLAGDPTPVLMSLKVQLEKPIESFKLKQEKMVEERDALVEKTCRQLGPIKRFIFKRLLKQAFKYGPSREEALFYIGAAWPVLRKHALELGGRFVNSGITAFADDIFYLKTIEIENAISARTENANSAEYIHLAEERRNLRVMRKRLNPPATVPEAITWKLGPINLSGRMSQRSNLHQGQLLKGFAVSAGKIKAPASVVKSTDDFKNMKPNTILVCPTTTPAWTPLFNQALGLVTDIGGIAAHGSIVAREYGIPAVMGTGTATQRIKNGQLVEVDGYAGTVKVIGEDDKK